MLLKYLLKVLLQLCVITVCLFICIDCLCFFIREKICEVTTPFFTFPCGLKRIVLCNCIFISFGIILYGTDTIQKISQFIVSSPPASILG